MKTLVYAKSQKQLKDFSSWAEDKTDIFLYCNETSTGPDALIEAADLARKEECELIIDAINTAGPNAVESILAELSDKEIPTEIIIGYSNDNPKAKKELLLLQVLTGETIKGFRSALRLYPCKLINNIHKSFLKDDFFYTRVLIHASRSGYKIKNIKLDDFTNEVLEPIPPKSFFIIELLKALRPWPRKRLCERNFNKEKFMEFLFHPIRFLKFLLMENSYPGGLAAAAATGMFLGTLPLLGFHTAAIIYVSIKLRLNKVLSVNISHLCMPPFVPFACIEIGYYMRNGVWLTTADFQTIVEELHLRLLDWLLGSLVLAPLNAIVFALITYVIAIFLKKALAKRRKYRVENSQ